MNPNSLNVILESQEETRIERTKHGDDESSNIGNDGGGLATLFLEDYKLGGVVLPLKANG